MDQLRAIKYFISVVESGSFTTSAKQFSVPPSSLSRRIADLENSLGATLLKRTTRVVKLTEVGQNYYREVKDIIQQLEVTNDAVRSYQSKPMGQLKISSMVGFGESIMLPLMEEFSELYPDIVLDISLSDELSTLGRDDVDIAIRGGYAPNERVVAVKLMDNQFYPFASNDYLSKKGTPVHPEDLISHQGLYFKTPQGPTNWLCEIQGQWQNVSAKAVVISNEGKWLVKQAINGRGILMVPRWVVAKNVMKKELTEIVIDPPVTISQASEFGVYLLYQKQKYNVPKIKAAVDFFVEKIKGK